MNCKGRNFIPKRQRPPQTPDASLVLFIERHKEQLSSTRKAFRKIVIGLYYASFCDEPETRKRESSMIFLHAENYHSLKLPTPVNAIFYESTTTYRGNPGEEELLSGIKISPVSKNAEYYNE